MDRLSDKIAQDQIVAATTQTKLRNGRRLRHNMTPETVMDPAASGQADDTHPDYPVPTLPAEMSPHPVSSPHTAITLSPLDLPSDQFRSGLDRRKQNRQLLMEWVRSALVENVDFGRVHIASKDKCELARSGRARECTNQWHFLTTAGNCIRGGKVACLGPHELRQGEQGISQHLHPVTWVEQGIGQRGPDQVRRAA